MWWMWWTYPWGWPWNTLYSLPFMLLADDNDKEEK